METESGDYTVLQPASCSPEAPLVVRLASNAMEPAGSNEEKENNILQAARWP